MKSDERPYILYVAEVIYSEISRIKKNNPDFSNINAIENFIGSNLYKEISSGKFHEEWFKELKKNYLGLKNIDGSILCDEELIRHDLASKELKKDSKELGSILIIKSKNLKTIL